MTEFERKVFNTLNDHIYLTECSSDDLDEVCRILDCTLHSGATRWALVFPKHKIVFKFPKYNETSRDYCAMELKNYELGKKFGIEKCLLPISYIGTLECDIPIYVQPMYTVSVSDTDYRVSRSYEEKCEKLRGSVVFRKICRGIYDTPPRVWVARATQIYGKKFMRKFEQWSHAGKVNDLHSSNVGWLRKQPIIIDYAGYQGD